MRRKPAASPSWQSWWFGNRTGFPGRAGGSLGAPRSTATGAAGRARRPRSWSGSCRSRRSTIGGGMAKRSAMSEPRTFTVAEDDDGIRLDRWFKRNLPEVSFNLVSRWARTGQLRIDGKRATPGDRIETGQTIRVPPPEAAPATPRPPVRKIVRLTPDEQAFVREMVIHEDKDAFVLAKPPGLATQGGTKTNQHLDRLLDGLADAEGRRPKLVHRLDKDTSGVLLVARTARAA